MLALIQRTEQRADKLSQVEGTQEPVLASLLGVILDSVTNSL